MPGNVFPISNFAHDSIARNLRNTLKYSEYCSRCPSHVKVGVDFYIFRVHLWPVFPHMPHHSFTWKPAHDGEKPLLSIVLWICIFLRKKIWYKWFVGLQVLVQCYGNKQKSLIQQKIIIQENTPPSLFLPGFCLFFSVLFGLQREVIIKHILSPLVLIASRDRPATPAALCQTSRGNTDRSARIPENVVR